MAISKQKKQEKVQQLAKELETSTTAIIGTFAKLTVAQDFALRKVIREAGGKYRVVKNKLAGISSQGTKVEGALKGLMPNPKTGTVTMDVASAVKEIKAGKVEFRADKTSLVHVPVGKLSFPPQKLVDNATTVITSIVRAKPSAAKGKYIKSVTLSSTMGPGVRIDPIHARDAVEEMAS